MGKLEGFALCCAAAKNQRNLFIYEKVKLLPTAANVAHFSPREHQKMAAQPSKKCTTLSHYCARMITNEKHVSFITKCLNKHIHF